jgi:hypothetical protein
MAALDASPGSLALTNGHTNGNGIHHANGEGAPGALDADVVRVYLSALLPALLGARVDELWQIFEDEFEERVARFAAEGSGVMYATKIKHDIGDDAPPTYTYHLAAHLTYSPSQVMTVALIKRTPLLDPTAPLATQIHVLNLFGGDDTPYESLHALVSVGVKPWFEAFAGSRGGGKDVDSKMGACYFVV